MAPSKSTLLPFAEQASAHSTDFGHGYPVTRVQIHFKRDGKQENFPRRQWKLFCPKCCGSDTPEHGTPGQSIGKDFLSFEDCLCFGPVWRPMVMVRVGRGKCPARSLHCLQNGFSQVRQNGHLAQARDIIRNSLQIICIFKKLPVAFEDQSSEIHRLGRCFNSVSRDWRSTLGVSPQTPQSRDPSFKKTIKSP